MDENPPLLLRVLGRLIGLAIIVAGITAAVMVGRTSSGNPRTDDAYVSANVIGVAPHVQGPLVQLNVVDNQPVEANELLCDRPATLRGRAAAGAGGAYRCLGRGQRYRAGDCGGTRGN